MFWVLQANEGHVASELSDWPNSVVDRAMSTYLELQFLRISSLLHFMSMNPERTFGSLKRGLARPLGLSAATPGTNLRDRRFSAREVAVLFCTPAIVYVYLHIYIYIYVCTHIHNTHTYIYTYLSLYIIYVYDYLYLSLSLYIYIYICTHIMCVHMYVHIYIYILYIYAHTLIHVHISIIHI